jgi:hypothetical protein
LLPFGQRFKEPLTTGNSLNLDRTEEREAGWMKRLRLLVTYLLLLSPAVATAATYEIPGTVTTTTVPLLSSFPLLSIASTLLLGFLAILMVGLPKKHHS